MKKHIENLLGILICGLNDCPLNKSFDEWDTLFKLAKAHSVVNLFYKAIKDCECVPTELKEKIKSSYLAHIHQQVMQEYFAEQVFNALEEKNIKYMPLKGYYLRKLYPSPELRTSCDIDFFYDDTKTAELNAIMQEQGFVEDKGGPNHSVWQNRVVTFEPHFYLLSDNDKFHAYYKDVWSRLKCERKSLYSFSDEDFYIFFMVHSAKHFTHGGFGIRTVLDVFVYNQKKELNREYLDKEFEKLGLKKFVKSIELLADCWFGGKPMDDDTKCISEYVMESGVYGISEHRNMLNNVKEKSVGRSKFSYFWKTLFLPYKQMKGRYPVLKKAPFLLPIFWVVRIFAVLFKRRENIEKTVKNMQSITGEQVAKYSKILQITEVPLD